MDGFTTKALHTGYKPNNDDGAVVPPIHLSSTFSHGNTGEFEYSRSQNPTRKTFEEVIAKLDCNSFGFAFSSGSAALATIVSLLEKDKKILFSGDVYGGTYRYIVNVAAVSGVKYAVADYSNESAVSEMLSGDKFGLIWLETPTNPLLKVTDIEWLAGLARKNNALLVVDNTFASPALQNPVLFGADLVVYSTTKYVNGHSDSIGGAVTTSNEDLAKQLRFNQNAMGNMLSPFDSWLTLRGLKTLELRMQRHTKNADGVVGLLTSSSSVAKVFYPGLGDKNQASIVKKQMVHPGAMVSFELGSSVDPKKFVSELKLIPLAESLGGIDTLLDHPASMTHASIPKAEREKIGLSDGLFRLSVGIENEDDLLDDLSNALKKATKKVVSRSVKS